MFWLGEKTPESLKLAGGGGGGWMDQIQAFHTGHLGLESTVMWKVSTDLLLVDQATHSETEISMKMCSSSSDHQRLLQWISLLKCPTLICLNKHVFSQI